MAVNFIKGEEFEGKLGEGVQILNFYADWCGPCKMLAPILEGISGETEIFKVNADENQEFLSQNGVSGLPTTFIYKNGEKVDQIVGFVPEELLVQKINSFK